MSFLSGQLGAVLQRRLREVGGIALISLAMMAALALATWSVHDPSLSHATDAPVHNLLGRPGAVAADLMMQLLGLGSLALLLPIAVWGYRLLGHRPLSHERLRVVLWLLGAVLAAAFASCLPRSSALAAAVGARRRHRRRHAALPAVLLRRAAGGKPPHRRRNRARHRRARRLRRRRGHCLARRAGRRRATKRGAEDEDDESAWISLGLLAHALLSLRARLARLFRRRAAGAIRLARRRLAAPRRRIEPQFDKPRRTATPMAEPTTRRPTKRWRAPRASRAARKDRCAARPAATHCRRSIC